MRSIVLQCAAVLSLLAAVYANGRGMCTHRYCGGLGDQDKNSVHTLGDDVLVSTDIDLSAAAYLNFRVKTCGAARLKFMTSTGHVFEIVLEANRITIKTIISVDKFFQRDTGLNCNDYRHFWVDWAQGSGLQIGDQTGVLVKWNFFVQDLKDIETVHVATATHPGDWDIYDPKLKHSFCCNRDGNEYCILQKYKCKVYIHTDLTRTPSTSYFKHLFNLSGDAKFDLFVCGIQHANIAYCPDT